MGTGDISRSNSNSPLLAAIRELLDKMKSEATYMYSDASEVKVCHCSICASYYGILLVKSKVVSI